MIEKILEWFELAVPTPTEKSMRVQVGVHFEEVAEMLTALNLKGTADVVNGTATNLKTGILPLPQGIDRIELLDSLCDQIVTAVGVAHMFGLDIQGGLREVNDSNWSKFEEDCRPVFDANGKIAKSANYYKPDLREYV